MTCRNCGQVVQMMCQAGTGFCSVNCQDAYAVHLETVRIATAELEQALRAGIGVRHAF